MAMLLVYFFVSHIISFLCSILEAVLLCCTNGYIGILKKKKPKAGEILEDLKERIDRPLAAILTFNTAAHTFGAAGVGAQVEQIFGSHSLAIVSVFLTLTMLFFTEMIPKTLGALYWKKIAPTAAFVIRFLITISYPFVISFEAIGRLLSRGKAQEKITEEEIKHILEEGNRAGVIKKVEHDMLESVFRLGNRRVNVLMIPRVDIEWIDIKSSYEEIKQQMDRSTHTRFPVCNEDLDQIIGYVSCADILNQKLSTGVLDIQSIMKPPLFVPENMRVVQLLDVFKKTPDHFALVTDEYGGIQGLITLHDVLESIVGGVSTSSEVAISQIIPRKDGSWLADGMLPIDELKEWFNIDIFPEEEKGQYRTLGGFVMKQMGRIPKLGDVFSWGGFRFKVIKMDERRVEKVLIQTIQKNK